MYKMLLVIYGGNSMLLNQNMVLKPKGKMHEFLIRIFNIILVLFGVYAISYISDYAALLIVPNFKSDQVLAWVWNSFHHIFMFAVTLLILRVFLKKTPEQAGLNFRNTRKWHIYIKWYCIIMTVFLLISTLVPFLASENIRQSLLLQYFVMPTKSKLTEILYMFIIPGIGEEPLYRAFVIIVLMKAFKGNFKVGKTNIPTAIIISPIFFMFAHMNIGFGLFAGININISQQILCLINGLYFAWVYYRTESLVPAIIIHNYCDVIISSLRYLIPYFYLLIQRI